jgi:hypothetical protein
VVIVAVIIVDTVLIKKTKMENKTSSLESFMWIVETQHPQIKKYIVSKTETEITIEDHMGDSIFGSNTDLSALYEWPTIFPIKKLSCSYKEREACFIVKVSLQ